MAKKRMARNRAGFPQRLFVHRENKDTRDEFLAIDEEANAPTADDGAPVAIYELREVKAKRVTHELK